MSDAKKPYSDPLVRQRVFPEPYEIFGFSPTSIQAALKKGIVAVDTNVLLVPYTTGRGSLEQIRETYSRLVKEKRLRIPGQVAREFAEQRAEKLKLLYQQLSRKRDINLSRSEYPLLEDIPAYADMANREEKISTELTAYRKVISDLLNVVTGWNWDDPVSQMYRDLFKKEVVVDPAFDVDETLKELKYCQEHRIPPGYKDANNEYSGVGDFLIWKTLLKIGEQESQHLIFVSGDEKTDWRYQSEGQPLYPRFELLDEYRRASKGKSLFIISFAQLLQQSGVPAPVVEEVKKEEAVALLSGKATESKSIPRREAIAHYAVLRWLSTKYPVEDIHINRSFPDFLIRQADSQEGYEVVYLSSSRDIRRAKEARGQIQVYSERLQMPISLVLVVDHEVHDPKLEVRISNILSGNWLDNALQKIVLGKLTPDDRFEESKRVFFGQSHGN